MADKHPSYRAIRPSSIARLLAAGIQTITGPWTWRNLFSWIAIITLVLFIKGCVVDQYTIPTGSMEPTLRGDPRFFRGDRVLVNKWLYGPRIPFTTRRLWKWGTPDRWDIVVFRAVEPDAAHPILIKRIVGLPGEHVHIRDGQILINGDVVTPPAPLDDILHYTNEFVLSAVEQQRQFLLLAQENRSLPRLNPENEDVNTLYVEMKRMHPVVQNMNIAALPPAELASLCADVHPVAFQVIQGLFTYLRPQMTYGVNDEPQYTNIPEDHYFMLGDNSAHSLDGRMYGWVPHNHLYGRAFAVWWPWTRRQDFTGFSYTWWGKSLLYGIPILILLIEGLLVFRDILRKKQKVC